MTDPEKTTATQALLARAHSPTSAQRLYNEKIKYRPFLLRPSSPSRASLNERDARRKARTQAKEAQKKRPKPLSARQRRRLGLYDVPKDARKYNLYEPLHRLWLGYMRELLGNDAYRGGTDCMQKLVGAEFTGARVEVVRSGCVSRVGLRGIVIKDSRHVFELITRENQVKLIPKEGTVFRIEVPVVEESGSREAVCEGPQQTTEPKFVFDIHGDQFLYRAADRSSRKWKTHFSKKL
jgi:ribonuclease P protein subunit POP4